MEKLRLLLSSAEIQKRVQEVAKIIEQDYQSKDLVILMVLKGSLCLVADLIRQIEIPFHLDVVQCSSYGSSGTQRKELKIFGLERIQIHNRDVLVTDDIFDSGSTMRGLYKALEQQKPRSIKSCVLLKKNVSHSAEVHPDYVLFPIEDLFVVGYGLDYKEQYRGLSDIYTLSET